MISFIVYGKAEAAGSKRAFVRGGRAQIVDANPRAKGWKSLVQDAALAALFDLGRIAVDLPLYRDDALIVDIVEYRVRPGGHYTTTGALSAEGRRKPHPTSAPDRDKISRGIADALAGLIYRDDSQICDGRVAKRWGEPARVEITVAPTRATAAPLPLAGR